MRRKFGAQAAAAGEHGSRSKRSRAHRVLTNSPSSRSRRRSQNSGRRRQSVTDVCAAARNHGALARALRIFENVRETVADIEIAIARLDESSLGLATGIEMTELQQRLKSGAIGLQAVDRSFFRKRPFAGGAGAWKPSSLQASLPTP